MHGNVSPPPDGGSINGWEMLPEDHHSPEHTPGSETKKKKNGAGF